MLNRLTSVRLDPTCHCQHVTPGFHPPEVRSASTHHGCRSSRAFTLVEIMIVVVIIGLLAAMAIPAMKRVIQKSETSTIANNLRVFSEAFQRYNLENGKWPSSAGNGVVPVVISVGYIKNGVWQVRKTPIGGRWRWTYSAGGVPFHAGISITNYTCSTQQLLDIDKLIDDGDLTTGNFQKFGTRVTFILEP